MNKYIAYCGLDCEKCEARIATVNNNDALRAKVAKQWSELNGVEITPEMINCDGCRVDGVKTVYCDSLCPIRKCAVNNGCDTCGECKNMNGCETLRMITGTNAQAAENLKKASVTIRRETERDYRAVEELIRESFWNVYRPGCLEHYVIHKLRGDPAFVPELDVVMEKDGRIIGQNMFMRAVIKKDAGGNIPIMTMGPICITPELKRQGYGKILLDDSLKKAAKLGCGALCFEGNIGFYGKSGFTYASEFGIRYHGLPEGADSSFFLCKELIPGYLNGITGEYGPPDGYYCADRDPEDFERFDAQFPRKEKKVLPGQLFK